MSMLNPGTDPNMLPNGLTSGASPGAMAGGGGSTSDASGGNQIGGKTMTDPGPAPSSGGPKDFSQDGAFGGSGGNASTATPAAAPDNAGLDYAQGKAGNYTFGAGGLTETPLSSGEDNFFQNWTGNGLTQNSGNYTFGGDGNLSFSPLGPDQQGGSNSAPPGGTSPVNGFMFADGGAIPDDNGDGSSQMNGLQASINAALSTVDNVLSYGRKLHGLSGGNEEDDGAIKNTQVAGRMPTVPGNSSDSGRAPIQPAPGPLPPTNNPFGKRADAGDDQGGAIDTDEETS
jgi:hypothetical protein